MQNLKSKLFARGKRGIIYKKGNIITKVKNPKSRAINRIKNEAKYLKILNKHGIGPKFISFKNNKLQYRFVKGKFIFDYIHDNDKKEILKVLKNVLNQCFILDKLKINKLEMNRPKKHIIIDKNPVLIDFERCYITDRPKNVTQFLQFLFNLRKILKKKKIIINKKILRLARKYKKNRSKKNFKKIKEYIN